VSEVDPEPADAERNELGGRPEPTTGDPTDGGKHGEIGNAPSITSDEPDDGSRYPVGGGDVSEETNAPPVADPGPDA
jgi:hypothetical protein